MRQRKILAVPYGSTSADPRQQTHKRKRDLGRANQIKWRPSINSR